MGYLDVIIPVKNRSAYLPELVSRVFRALEKAGIRSKIVFIDDYSTDQTLKTLEKLSDEYPIEYLLKKGQSGKTYSIVEGFKRCSTEYVAILDADSAFPPEIIPQMFAKATRHHLVVAENRTEKESVRGRIITATGKFLADKLRLDLDCDIHSGLKIVHRNILSHLEFPDGDTRSLDMQLFYTARELGCKVGKVEAEFEGGWASNRQRLSTCLTSLKQAVKLRLAERKSYEIPAEEKETSKGAGVIFRRQRFITHTKLSKHQSAMDTFLPWQKHLIIGVLAVTVGSFVIWPMPTAIGMTAILTTIYFVDVLFNAYVITKSLRIPPEMSFSPKQISVLTDDKLPVYTILCPLYKEARVLPDFIDNIKAIDWPKNKLDVMLLLEEDDRETIKTAEGMNLPAYIRTVVVPHSLPKTKPKACNYGLSKTKGEYSVIYDAEDRPDPLQLKKAYLGFLCSGKEVACLQAKLNYYNPKHNLLTRLFTSEYSLWFDVILPGLQSIETTIPLGGTSNHFRTEVLKEIHGWDAFNVTEDCDLGVRLFKMGYRTAIIDSTTLEEANSRMGSWFRQRSRWIKGYLQTFFVHNRHPLRFIRSHGIHAFIFQLIVGGKNAFILINPLLWLTTISYFLFRAKLGPTIEALYPPVIFYMASFSLVFGNFVSLYYYMLGCARRGSWWLVKYIYLVPFYWLMMSLAAVKAVYQLIFRPHYWEKTTHGLHLMPAVRFSWPRFDIRLPRPAFAAESLLVGSNIVTNGLNFLYNAFLGREVRLEEFGLISLFGSILYLLQVPAEALGRTVSHHSAYIKGKLNQPATAFWRAVRRRSLVVSLLTTAVWVAAVPFLTQFFHAGSSMPFYIFSPVITLATLSAVDGGYLLGNMKFAVLAIAGVTAGTIKLATSYIFVRWSIPDMIYLAIPISFLLSLLVMRKAILRYPQNLLKPDPFPSHFFTTSLVFNLSVIMLLGVDVILAKHFLDPVAAGQYAILSLAGKIVYFLSGLFSQFVTPLVSFADGAGRDHQKMFYKLLSAVLVVGIAGYLFVGVGGGITIPLLFGEKSQAIIRYLPAYTLSMVLLSVGMTIVSYHQVLKLYYFSYAGLAISVVQTAAFAYFHSSIRDFVIVIQATAILYAMTNLVMHIFSYRSDIISRNLKDLRDLFVPGKKSLKQTKGLRILVLNWRDIRHKWAGGAEVYVHELAKRWAKSGHQVTVFCGNDGDCPRQQVTDGVRIVRRGGIYTVYIWAFLYYIFRFRNRFDVVIDSENGIPFFAPLYTRLPTFLLVYHVHQNFIRKYLKFPLSTIGSFLESGLMPWVYRNQQIVSISESTRNDLLKFKGFRAENIMVVNPGVSPDLLPKYPKTTFPSFLYLGRIRPYKKVDVAIRAFAEVARKYPEARLTVAGEGENLTELITLADKVGMSDKVAFTGRVDEEITKPRLLGESWVMIQPSSIEGWGITVIEANACGTPVIASDTVGLRDSVVEGETGWLVPVGDEDSLAKVMLSVIERPDYLAETSRKAHEWSKSFSWDKHADLFLALIYAGIPKYKYGENSAYDKYSPGHEMSKAV